MLGKEQWHCCLWEVGPAPHVSAWRGRAWNSRKCCSTSVMAWAEWIHGRVSSLIYLWQIPSILVRSGKRNLAKVHDSIYRQVDWSVVWIVREYTEPKGRAIPHPSHPIGTVVTLVTSSPKVLDGFGSWIPMNCPPKSSWVGIQANHGAQLDPGTDSTPSMPWFMVRWNLPDGTGKRIGQLWPHNWRSKVLVPINFSKLDLLIKNQWLPLWPQQHTEYRVSEQTKKTNQKTKIKEKTRKNKRKTTREPEKQETKTRTKTEENVGFFFYFLFVLFLFFFCFFWWLFLSSCFFGDSVFDCFIFFGWNQLSLFYTGSSNYPLVISPFPMEHHHSKEWFSLIIYQSINI